MSYDGLTSEKKYNSSQYERNPRCYKEVEKVLKEVKACKGNLKTVLYNSRHRGGFFKKVYSLAENVLKHRLVLEKVIEEIELSEKEPFLRKEYAGILIYELILGKGLPGNSKPVLTIKKYENEIREAYNIVKKDGNLCPKGLYTLPRYVRVNTLVTSVSNVLDDLRNGGFQQMQYDRSTSFDGYMNLVKSLQVGYFLIDFHFKDLLVFASKENLHGWHLYREGHIFLQDKSSYIPVHVLDPKPDSTVIDSCAAPGMKTIHIASAMKNQGQIYAYERDQGRFQILQNMLDSANVNICEAACEDFYTVATNDPKFNSLEYILVDPSCSGSGMVNRMDSVTDTEDSKNRHRLEKLAGFQILLLKHALSFPSVKRVVYSTCSITEEENEFVVHEVLNKFSNLFKLVSVMPDWPFRGSDNFEFGHLCLRAYPDKSLTNGFFVAMFERLEGDEYESFRKPKKNSKKTKKEKDVNFSEGEIDCELSGKLENKSGNGKHQEILYCAKQELIFNDSDKIEHADDMKAADELEANAVKKKHKRARCHSEDQETPVEGKFDKVSENDSDLKTLHSNDIVKKKHKKKRHHLESETAEGMAEPTEGISEYSIHSETTTDDFDNTVKKQHKRKKCKSKDREEPLAENLDENSGDLEDNLIKKKHKKKKQRKTSDDGAQTIDIEENTSSILESNTIDEVEEILIKKKHKRKTKFKNSEDEGVKHA